MTDRQRHYPACMRSHYRRAIELRRAELEQRVRATPEYGYADDLARSRAALLSDMSNALVDRNVSLTEACSSWGEWRP